MPPNCQFFLEDITQPDWYQGYGYHELVRLEGSGVDKPLLENILKGAFQYVLSPDLYLYLTRVIEFAHLVGLSKYVTQACGSRIPIKTAQFTNSIAI